MEGFIQRETVTVEINGPDGTLKDRVQIVIEKRPGQAPVVVHENKMLPPAAAAKTKGEKT